MTPRRRWFPLYTDLYRASIPREWKLAIGMLGMLMVDRWATDRLSDEQATHTRLSLGDQLDITGCPTQDEALAMLRAIAKSRAITITIKLHGNGFLALNWPKFAESLKGRRPDAALLEPGYDPAAAPPSSSSSTEVDTDSEEARPRRKRPAAAAAIENLPALRFAQDFRAALVRVHEGFKPPTDAAFAKWVTQSRLLIAERTDVEVRLLAKWLFDATSPSEGARFWRFVVLSLPKFREKFEQIAARRRGEGERHGPRAAGNTTSDLAERARAAVRARAAGADGAR